MVSVRNALGSYDESKNWFSTARFCNAGLLSDLTIVIDGVNFHLHKFPLLSRSGKIEKLIKETQNNDKESCIITLEDIPGGANSFLAVANFCYGVHVELTPTNIVMVYYMAEYLEMSDEYGDDNLLSKTETYFHTNILKNWKDCMVALRSCESIVTKTDNLQIISKCLNAMSTMVQRHEGSSSILWNGIDTGARIQTSESEWWFEDVSNLSVVLFKRLIKTMEAKGIQPEMLSGAIMYYSGKYLHGLDRWQSTKTRITTKYDIFDQRLVLESIVDLLPNIKGKSFCRFLLGLLRVGLILGVDEKCQESLERRIGMQLEFATLDGIMIPSYSDSDTLYNTECVERMINYFLTFEEKGSDLKSLMNVSKLVDSYIAEIASDVNLKPEKIHSLAKALPESSRSLNDGLYRALDIYIKAHSWLSEDEKEGLYDIIEWQKLSVDACAHASQNLHLPLRFVLKVLFFEQMHVKTALSGFLRVLNDENNPTYPMVNGGEGRVSLVRENELLRVGMERMRLRVSELEQEFKKLRKEMTRMSGAHILNAEN